MEMMIAGGVAAVCVVVAVFFWVLKAKAEQETSGVRIALDGLREANVQLRADHAADLNRLAAQYVAQIGDLNGKLLAAQKRADESSEEVRRLSTSLKAMEVSLAAERSGMEEKRRHYETLLAKMRDEFRSLSEGVLQEKREAFEREGLVGVAKFTNSLLQEVKSFRDRVDKINEADVERTASLRKDIETLVGQTRLVSAEADKLASAIRSDAQVTGLWGEVQLIRVLELGGLQRTVDYDYQETFASPGGSRADLRTDVLVKMPDSRWLVIDAKTTMAAYVDYVGEDGKRDAAALERIVNSLIEHVKEMKTAGYHRKLEQTTGRRILNTMLMYIPFEEVYLTAMKCEVDGPGGKIPLREWAWRNDVVFVNASGLIPLVRMLAELWARDRSEKKALQIKEAAESLVDKFRVFLEGSAGNRKDGFLAVGAGLMSAVTAFNESVRRLSDGRGSILRKLSDLKDMGVASTDKLPPPEQVEARKVGVSPALY